MEVGVTNMMKEVKCTEHWGRHKVGKLVDLAVEMMHSSVAV
jgi:hypothetical protein